MRRCVTRVIVVTRPVTASHAFLWEHGGPMVNLNTILSGSKLDLFGADFITDQGEIVVARIYIQL